MVNTQKRQHKTSRRRSMYRKKSHKKRIGGKKDVYSSNSFDEVIEFIKGETVDKQLDHEICGSVKMKKPGENVLKYTVFIHEVAPLPGNRPSCRHEDYSHAIIWHNHPIQSKFYPSIEDIVKVIKRKNKDIKRSLIFSNFGYWNISSVHHIEVESELEKNIRTILDRLYSKTNKGRQYVPESVVEIIDELNQLLQNIVVITFTPF